MASAESKKAIYAAIVGNFLIAVSKFVAAGITWVFAWRAFRTEKGSRGVLATVRDSKDPTSFVVLFEDTAALAGIVVAAAGIWLSHRLEMPAIDGAASIVIGVILCTIAWFLAAESKALLVGERADPETVESIRRLTREEDAVERVGRVLTMHLGPREVLVNVEVEFRRDLDSGDVERAVDRVEAAIREAHPEVGRIFIEAEGLSR